MNFSSLWGRFIAQQRKDRRLAQFRGLSTSELKAAWDAFDCDAKQGEPGEFWPAEGPHLEDVHRLLNERGEGAYCAV